MSGSGGMWEGEGVNVPCGCAVANVTVQPRLFGGGSCARWDTMDAVRGETDDVVVGGESDARSGMGSSGGDEARGRGLSFGGGVGSCAMETLRACG